MGLKKDIEDDLRKKQRNLLERVERFIVEENILDSQIPIFYGLVRSSYSMGLETLGSGKGTDYKPEEFLAELKKRVSKYIPRDVSLE